MISTRANMDKIMENINLNKVKLTMCRTGQKLTVKINKIVFINEV